MTQQADDPVAKAVKAVQALPESDQAHVAAQAVKALSDDARANVAKQAIGALPEAAKADLATAAVDALPDNAKADVATAAARSLPAEAQDELAERLAPPDQAVTNEIWRWIVKTFAIVLVAATVALVGAVFVSFWRRVNADFVQILLTVFTTVAGILAGFVSGRASTGRGARR